MKVILALDQGTTSSRALVVADDGRVLASSQRQTTQHYPQSGWVEQDPLEIWETQRATAADALRRSGLSVASVAALGIANQRETTVVWERATSRPIAPAIVWQDRRTADACDQLRSAGHEPLVHARTGLLLDPYFSATKLRWILQAVPGALDRARRGELAFGTIDTWLAWQLSGGRLHVTDATNASRTMLYDLRSGDWDDELLELFAIPRAVMPAIVDSCGVIGETDAGFLGAPLPLAGIAGDQQAALFGQACTTPGMAKITYGTGCFFLLHSGERPLPASSSLLSTVALQRDGRRTYALEGSVFVGGAAVQWLRDGLGILSDAADVDRLAASVPTSDGVVFVTALTGLGAPHWDPRARGAVLGITRGTTAAHIARAALEGIAFQVADLVATADSGARPVEVRADGGASGSDLLLQTQADLLGVPVVRTAQPEATALGAAYLAGLAVGLWQDDDVRRLWRADRRFDPAPTIDRVHLTVRWHAAVAAVRAFGERGA